MFNEMRRQDRVLGEDETQEILHKGLYGFLSVHGLNDYPYGIPVNYVYNGECIYIHAALEGQKNACLRCNNKVAFCVVREAVAIPDEFSTRYKSAIVFGKALELSGNEKLDALNAIVSKYADSDECIAKGKQYALAAQDKTAVFRINIEHLTGKARR